MWEQILNWIKDQWPTFVSGGVGGLSVLGIIYFFGQKVISNRFEKNLKEYENKLQMLKVKDEIKFHALHSEMVTRMSNIFCMIAELYKEIIGFTVVIERQKDNETVNFEPLIEIMNKAIKFKSYLIESSIFLPQKLYDDLNELYSLYTIVSEQLRNTREANKDKIETINTDFQKKHNELTDLIRGQVKSIFGVDPNMGAVK